MMQMWRYTFLTGKITAWCCSLFFVIVAKPAFKSKMGFIAIYGWLLDSSLRMTLEEAF
ncbi:hypothetical protein [Paenibacillus amylolyticus]|uniref:hypothetical protein n=1 Tax=Paenibacillus amylolyticus TaxID=1451 RepID=UPI003EBE1998